MLHRPVHTAFLLFIAICASLRGGLVIAAEPSDALLTSPNATNVWTGTVGWSDQLTYHVDAKFPAAEVIDSISHKLQKAGWEPLKYDFLDPALPSSQVSGWQEFPHGIKDPKLCVHQWLGDWKDAAGNIVRYTFRYKHPGCDTSDLKDLEVSAAYVRAAAVQQARQMFKQLEKQHTNTASGSAGKPNP
jgi:hypothetical protein